MSDLPKISIVMPCLNQARFLRQAMESVLDQGYPDLEFIVVDGGSTDDSPSVIRSLERHLTWWISEADGGQAAAINKGFARATGDVFGWLNSDDYYLDGALQRVCDAHGRNPEAGLWFGNGLRVDEHGKLISVFQKSRITVARHTLAYGVDYLLQPSTFFSRAAWERVGGLREDLRWCLDWDLWIRIADAFASEEIDAVLAVTREHGETKTATGGFQRWTEIREVSEHHTGMQLTPGALAYFLHTLHDYLRADPQAIEYLAGVQRLTDQYWGAVSEACLRPLDGSGDAPELRPPLPEAAQPRDDLLARDRAADRARAQRLRKLVDAVDGAGSPDGRELAGHVAHLQRQLAEQGTALADLRRGFQDVAARLEQHAEKLHTMERRLWVKAGKALRLI